MTDNIQKLQLLNEEPALAIFDELTNLNESLKSLIEATKSAKTETVSVDNLSDAIVDLTPLERNFEALKASVEQVTTAIQSIPKDKEMDMSGIEKLLKQIANKEAKETDVTELTNISDILDNVLYGIQTIASHANDKEENPADKIVPELKGIADILNVLNENVVSIDTPAFDYEKLAKIIKENLKISIAAGGGSSGIVRKIDGSQINPATSEKQGQYYDAETGTWSNQKGVDGASFSLDYFSAIIMGLIPGHKGFKGMGERQVLSTATTGDDVWEGTATTIPIPPDAGDLISVVSTSVQDGVAGTGAQIIDIHYIDPTGNAQSTLVTMNGTTIVNTGILMRFVQVVHSQTLGSGGATAGNITISKTGTPTTIYNQITAGGNASLSSARMVPLGKVYAIKKTKVSGASNKSVRVRLRATTTEEGVLNPRVFRYIDIDLVQNSIKQEGESIIEILPALSIVKFTAYSSQAGGDVVATHRGHIE